MAYRKTRKTKQQVRSEVKKREKKKERGLVHWRWAHTKFLFKLSNASSHKKDRRVESRAKRKEERIEIKANTINIAFQLLFGVSVMLRHGSGEISRRGLCFMCHVNKGRYKLEASHSRCLVIYLQTTPVHLFLPKCAWPALWLIMEHWPRRGNCFWERLSCCCWPDKFFTALQQFYFD